MTKGTAVLRDNRDLACTGTAHREIGKSGAGGNRTPVSRQSASRFYACVHSFDLDPWGEDWHPPHGSSPRCCLAGHPRARRMFASLMFVIPRPIRRVAGDAQPVLGRESVIAIVSNYCVACFLRGQHAPRRATAGLPCSVETSSAPDVKDAGDCTLVGVSGSGWGDWHGRSRFMA